jgi:hypothetical protein
MELGNCSCVTHTEKKKREYNREKNEKITNSGIGVRRYDMCRGIHI